MLSGEDSERQGAGAGAEDHNRRWLLALQRIGQRSGHELRNALNGASVNLEVVRGRAARSDGRDLATFAETAASQLEEVAKLAEALLTLVRPLPEASDLGALASPLVVLLDAISRADEGRVQLVRDDAEAVRTTLSPLSARLVLAELLLEAQEGGATLSCEVASRPASCVRLRRAGGLPEPSESARRLATSAGVVLTHEPAVWTAVFPQ